MLAKEKAVKKQWPLFSAGWHPGDWFLASPSLIHAQLTLSGGESSVTTTSAKAMVGSHAQANAVAQVV